MDGPFDVDVHDSIPEGVVERFDRHWWVDAGVSGKDVDAPEVVDNASHGFFHRDAVTDVRPSGNRVAAGAVQCLHRLLRSVCVAVKNSH